jgi:hypothetical protein
MQNSEITTLREQAFHYRQQIDKCVDAIKMLQGYTPKDFTFRFTIGSAQIFSFDIQEQEGDLCISFFMMWRSFYSKKLTDIQKALQSAGVALAVEGVPGL